MESNRKKVQEFKEGSVVVEIYQKEVYDGAKVFHDFRIGREYRTQEGEIKRGSMIQNRDSLDAVVAITKAHKHINHILKTKRNSYFNNPEN